MAYRLLVGLGNPGKAYEATRHNIGFRVLDAFAKESDADDWKSVRSLKGELCSCLGPEQEKLYLLKPTTYMNDSGTSVQKALSYYKIPPEEVIVIYDEVNLDTAQVKVSVQGSAGGHNGMADILSHIPPRFARLRIGVGPKQPAEMDLADFVLGKFTSDEEALIASSLNFYIECLQRLLREGPDKAMTQINRRNNTDD